MSPEPAASPVRYAREVETPDRRAGHTPGGAGAGSHVLLNAVLIVEPDLPAALRRGMFASEARYPVIMRFSTAAGDGARGLALKVYGVIGDRLPGAEGQAQDFVMATARRRHAETHILGDSFVGQAPVRFGDSVARIGVAPVSPGLKALTGQPLELADAPAAMSDSVVEFFANHRAEWELRVELCTDRQDTPVGAAGMTVARIRADPQRAWKDSGAEPGDDALIFSPWNSLAAHRPLDSIMEPRPAVYEASAAERELTIAPEPRSFSPLADL